MNHPVDKKGITSLQDTLSTELKSSDLEALGILVDADTDLQSRWQSLRTILTQAGYSVPETPVSTGTILRDEERPSVGIWLMPDNNLPGVLENFVAETLSKAKDTSVGGMVEAGILASGRGKVRLLKPSELPADWDPARDKRLTTWEMIHQLIRVLESEGESAAAALEAQLGAQAETARELCYRLYTLCERNKRSAEALSYNALVQSWPEITRLAREEHKPVETQAAWF